MLVCLQVASYHIRGGTLSNRPHPLYQGDSIRLSPLGGLRLAPCVFAARRLRGAAGHDTTGNKLKRTPPAVVTVSAYDPTSAPFRR